MRISKFYRLLIVLSATWIVLGTAFEAVATHEWIKDRSAEAVEACYILGIVDYNHINSSKIVDCVDAYEERYESLFENWPDGLIVLGLSFSLFWLLITLSIFIPVFYLTKIAINWVKAGNK